MKYFLVVDAMTGQDAVNVAQNFNETVGITGVVLTKLDGDTRGGAAFPFVLLQKNRLNLSGWVKKWMRLKPFHPERMASRILRDGRRHVSY